MALLPIGSHLSLYSFPFLSSSPPPSLSVSVFIHSLPTSLAFFFSLSLSFFVLSLPGPAFQSRAHTNFPFPLIFFIDLARFDIGFRSPYPTLFINLWHVPYPKQVFIVNIQNYRIYSKQQPKKRWIMYFDLIFHFHLFQVGQPIAFNMLKFLKTLLYSKCSMTI